MIDNSSEDKKAKSTKKCVTKRTIRFQDFNNCLEATQLEILINHLKKNEIDVDSLKKDQKEFINNNKLTLKVQQRFKRESYNGFTKKINKIALISNSDKRMQSINSIETYAYVLSKKEEIKCNNIIKQLTFFFQNDLLLWCYKRKHETRI